MNFLWEVIVGKITNFQEYMKWAVKAGVEHQQWRLGTFCLKAKQSAEQQ